jgi:hypothetical protein
LSGRHQGGAIFYRRLYFVIPDERQAVQVVEDIESSGVDRQYIHAIAGKGAALTQLPPVTEPQRHDAVWRLERAFWIGNLLLFSLALIGFVVSVIEGALVGAVLSFVILALSFIAGALFAMRVPDTHLDEFRGVLSHREVLLMVDVPKWRVAEVEEIVYRRHPEVAAGGAGWTIHALGI